MSKIKFPFKAAQKIISDKVLKSNFTRQEVVRGKQARVQSLFNEIKREMLQEFLGNEVTKEIQAGGDYNGGLLAYGNLFSFIGFVAGDDPIEPVTRRFSGVSLTANPNNGWDALFTILDFPSAQDIFDITPMPWASGRSWAQGIETGISGLGQYLYHPEGFVNSRSGAGLQVKSSPIRSGKFPNRPYISALIKKYRLKFQTLDNVTVL